MTTILKNNFKALAFIALIFSAISFSTSASATFNKEEAFIQSLSDTALMSLTEKKVSRKTREDRVREILNKNFDINTIGKFALGLHWRTASKNQKDEYLKLFENMIVETYTTRFEDYSGETLEVKKSVQSGKRDVLVESAVIQKDGPPLKLEWRVRKKNGSLRIIDVVVEGVSMSVTQRSDFASVIQSGGGDINALLKMLRERKKADTKNS